MSTPKLNTWHRLVANGSQARFLIGASIFRIVAGFTVLLQYLINYKQRHYLYGPDGLFPWDLFVQSIGHTSRLSVYAWNRSPIYFEICFHLGILLTTLWALGWRTRWTTPLTFFFWWSLHQRCLSVWDGGDNLMRLAFIYAMFADVGRHFSLDEQRRRRQTQSPQAMGPAASLCHHAAILAFALQVSLVYGIAGLYKVQGETWQEGTALYYALRGGQFVWPGFSELIYQNVYLVALLSYVTVAYQVSFPFLLFMNRYTRLLAVCLSVLFHIGIALFLGLITFAFFMMAVDLALIDDSEYRALARMGKRLWQRATAWKIPRLLAGGGT